MKEARIPVVYYSKARLARIKQEVDDARELIRLAEQRQPAPTFQSLAQLARSGFQFDLENHLAQQDGCPDC
jgi:hypothetical protein